MADRDYVYKREEPEYKVLIDLGIFTVPDNYNDKTCVKDFKQEFNDEVFLDRDLSDEHAKEACGVKIKPGDKFHAYIYEYISEVWSISSGDIIRFLRKNNFSLLEVKGIILAYSQKKDLIPKSRDYYYSLGDSSFLPVWLNFQQKMFLISYQSVDGYHYKGALFFAFKSVN